MPIVQMFKSTKRSNRFNQNQKVWIIHIFGNHLKVKYKYRGKYRMVTGTISRHSLLVGEIKDIEVTDNFYQFLYKDELLHEEVTPEIKGLKYLISSSVCIYYDGKSD